MDVDAKLSSSLPIRALQRSAAEKEKHEEYPIIQKKPASAGFLWSAWINP